MEKKPARDSIYPQETDNQIQNPENAKTASLKQNTSNATNEFMTTDHGVRINDDQNSLKAGDRGPTLEIPIKLTTLNRSKLTTYFTGEEVEFMVCIG